MIAQGSTVRGTLQVHGVVQVDGVVEGNLIAEGHVSVGPEGRVIGDVQADALSVGGHVEGTAVVRGHMHLLSTGRVQGDATYETLEVDRGGVVDGRTQVLQEVQRVPDNDVQAVDAAE